MDPEPGATTEPETPEAPDWAAYYRYTHGREPRPLFANGMAALDAAGLEPGPAVEPRIAVEVGFGDGTETLALLARGWRVTAIDAAPAAAEVLDPLVPDADRARLTVVTAPADEVTLPPFDLLYSGYVLAYLAPDAFARLWAHARERLRPGGFLVVNLFGDRHEWAGKEPDTTFLARPEVDRLLEGLEVVALDEIEEDGNSFVGPTHWHVWDVIARRPAGVSEDELATPMTSPRRR